MKAFKLIRLATAAAALLAFGSGAFAQTLLSNASVGVSVTLSSKCQWTTSAPGSLAIDFGTYTAFQGSAKTPASPQTFSVDCTRNFGGSPTITWDATGGTVAGLEYSVSATAAAPTGGTAATASSIGTPDTIVFTLSGSIPANQAGDSTATATDTRKLTLTF